MGEAESQLYSPASNGKLPDAEKENPGGDKEEYPDLDKPVEEENSYILYEEEVFAAYPEDKVTPDVKRYEGFTSPEHRPWQWTETATQLLNTSMRGNIHKLKLVDRGSMKIIWKDSECHLVRQLQK